jgi:hypothetical protein
MLKLQCVSKVIKDAGIVHESFRNKTNQVIWNFWIYELNPQYKSLEKKLYELNPQYESFEKSFTN